MSYVVARAPLGNVVEDRQVGLDFLATWFLFKRQAADVLDIYRDANKGALVGPTTRNAQPMFTSAHARAIHTWLAKTGQKAIAHARAHGDSGTGAMERAVASYKSSFSAMSGRFNDSFYGRMPLAVTDEFVRITETFARGMSSGQWAAFNEPTKTQMLRQALNETPGGSLITGIADAALFVGKGLGFAIGNFGTILKVAFVGGIGYLGYRAYKGVRE